ncbi:hypothetical protein V202x_20110 [Gimesia aquarii]|uniref:Uncharacterized protein n=1 Tax=Gimesia aquarii TaxID=2527964 RepID=A0A517WTR4_9PLAN|nr:hypothetical protein V202x_20110 [Gimesia aquarii]
MIHFYSFAPLLLIYLETHLSFHAERFNISHHEVRGLRSV